MPPFKTDEAGSSPLGRRRWLQFSLRSLLGLTLLACLALGLMAHRAQQERALVAELETLGVKLHRSEMSAFMQWMHFVFGENLVGNGYTARVEDGLTSEQVDKLRRLPHLRIITLVYVQSTPYREVAADVQTVRQELPGVKVAFAALDR